MNNALVIVHYNDSVSVINNTYGGNLVVHAKAKLPEKPTHIEFDIHDADIIDDSESVISIL